MDFESIEKRIPAYQCMEPALIEIFEKKDEPPYWGSDHNLLCSLLWPDLYNPIAHIKGEFKKKYINEYKRAKNTNFAKQYGAGKRKVDATAGVPGAFEKISRGMPKLAALQAYYLDLAERTGYVETLPDKSVDPTRGYPILASRTEDGRVLSTTPFNYHVSGTACWCKNRALVRCSEQLEMWRAEGFDGYIALEIHDEILFDFPKGNTPDANLDRALTLKKLMEESGSDIGIPLPVSVEYHDTTWAKGVPPVCLVNTVTSG
jgi:DNA polymerase I-like protein with 3'-5' exonuclease and polymerase domains